MFNIAEQLQAWLSDQCDLCNPVVRALNQPVSRQLLRSTDDGEMASSGEGSCLHSGLF